MRNAMNEVTRVVRARLRDGLKRWNRLIGKGRLLVPPHPAKPALPPHIGAWAGVPTDPAGQPISQREFNARKGSWLPSEADRPSF